MKIIDERETQKSSKTKQNKKHANKQKKNTEAECGTEAIVKG